MTSQSVSLTPIALSASASRDVVSRSFQATADSVVVSVSTAADGQISMISVGHRLVMAHVAIALGFHRLVLETEYVAAIASHESPVTAVYVGTSQLSLVMFVMVSLSS